jgi:hypothetical protein
MFPLDSDLDVCHSCVLLTYLSAQNSFSGTDSFVHR